MWGGCFCNDKTSTLGLNTLFVKVSLIISNWDNHANDLETTCCLTQYVRHCILLQNISDVLCFTMYFYFLFGYTSILTAFSL